MGFLEHRRIFFFPSPGCCLVVVSKELRNSLVKRELAVEHFMVF